MNTKPVLLGQIIDGEVAVGNVIYLDFEIYKGLFYIESIEGVRSSNLDTIGLVISHYDANLDDKIKTLIGHTIDVYNFSHCYSKLPLSATGG